MKIKNNRIYTLRIYPLVQTLIWSPRSTEAQSIRKPEQQYFKNEKPEAKRPNEGKNERFENLQTLNKRAGRSG